MEYEYAQKIGVPVISFLPKSPEKIPVGKTDRDKTKEQKLEDFKKLASEKMVKFWETSEELGSAVSRSLIKLIRTKPRTGWVKADKISSDEANIEILELRQKIRLLEEELKSVSNMDAEDLSQGDDIFTLFFTFKKYAGVSSIKDSMEIAWDNLFSKTCPILMSEAKEEDYRNHVNGYILFLLKQKYSTANNVQIVNDNFMSILIQFKALCLIEKGIKKRSLKDTGTYWKLTTKGEDLITKLRALKRDKIADNFIPLSQV